MAAQAKVVAFDAQADIRAYGSRKDVAAYVNDPKQLQTLLKQIAYGRGGPRATGPRVG